MLSRDSEHITHFEKALKFVQDQVCKGSKQHSCCTGICLAHRHREQHMLVGNSTCDVCKHKHIHLNLGKQLRRLRTEPFAAKPKGELAVVLRAH